MRARSQTKTRLGTAAAARLRPSAETARAEASGKSAETVRVICPSMASRRVSRPSGSRTAKNRPSGEAMTKPNPAI